MFVTHEGKKKSFLLIVAKMDHAKISFLITYDTKVKNIEVQKTAQVPCEDYTDQNFKLG